MRHTDEVENHTNLPPSGLEMLQQKSGSVFSDNIAICFLVLSRGMELNRLEEFCHGHRLFLCKYTNNL